MSIPKSTGRIKGTTHKAREVGSILRKSREKGFQEREEEGFQLAKKDTVLQGQKDQVKAARPKINLRKLIL